MNHPEADYINGGHRYEQAQTPAAAQAAAAALRHMIEAEDIEDRAEARRLIERGRAEARQ